jgi:hypothetical protein
MQIHAAFLLFFFPIRPKIVLFHEKLGKYSKNSKIGYTKNEAILNKKSTKKHLKRDSPYSFCEKSELWLI